MQIYAEYKNQKGAEGSRGGTVRATRRHLPGPPGTPPTFWSVKNQWKIIKNQEKSMKIDEKSMKIYENH